MMTRAMYDAGRDFSRHAHVVFLGVRLQNTVGVDAGVDSVSVGQILNLDPSGIFATDH